MIRRPLRPLARILSARAAGRDPDLVEAEERAARLRARHRAERAKAETRLLLLGVVFILGFATVGGPHGADGRGAMPVEPRAGASGEPILRAARRHRRPQRRDPRDQPRHRLALRPAARDDRPGARGATSWRGSSPTSTRTALHGRFTDGRKFLWIKRTISPEQRQGVHDLGEPGLLFGPRETRLYPNGAVAAHILGGASYGREGVRRGRGGRRRRASSGSSTRGCATRRRPASRCGCRSTSPRRRRSRRCSPRAWPR